MHCFHISYPVFGDFATGTIVFPTGTFSFSGHKIPGGDQILAIVKTDVPTTAKLCDETVLALTERYPACRSELLAVTAFGRPVRTLVIGTGPRTVLFTAAHHANEWITAPLLLKFMEELAQAAEDGGQLLDTDARALLEQVRICTVPMVDPDGVDLVTGGIQPGQCC